ncbi:MAG: hypothetical protein MI741_04690, partial [Rhodospirillales bacterium]|nr:hypothetical protein [Rhodospirillales bacterium]
TFPDTHGSPLLGMGWTGVAAAIDRDNMRNLMDYNRWWLVLAECHDGEFVYQPNRDNNAQDYFAAPRTSAMAAIGFIFSVKEQRLAIMGAKTVVPGFNENELSAKTRPIYEAIGKDDLRRAFTMIDRLEKDEQLSEKDKQVVERLRTIVLNPLEHVVGRLKQIEEIGDVTRLDETIRKTLPRYRGIKLYDEVVEPMQRALRKPGMQQELRMGKRYAYLLDRAERTREKRDIAKLEAFAKDNPDSFYGKAAADALKHLRTDEEAKNLRDAYFEKLLKQMERTD